MAKQKRGKVLKLEKNWRGTCPVCGRKRVKLVWPETSARGARMVCKSCYSRADTSK